MTAARLFCIGRAPTYERLSGNGAPAGGVGSPGQLVATISCMAPPVTEGVNVKLMLDAASDSPFVYVPSVQHRNDGTPSIVCVALMVAAPVLHRKL